MKTHYAAQFCAGYPGVAIVEGVTDFTEGVDFIGYTMKNGKCSCPKSQDEEWILSGALPLRGLTANRRQSPASCNKRSSVTVLYHTYIPFTVHAFVIAFVFLFAAITGIGRKYDASVQTRIANMNVRQRV